MITTIKIEGQISGNFTLNNSIARNSNDFESGRGMFNSFWIKYKSKTSAKEAIRKAYKELISDEPYLKGRLGGIRKSKDGRELYYDASKAVISNG